MRLKRSNNSMIVGEYQITELEDGSYWIVNESGEAMQISKEAFDGLIDEFFKAVF